MSAGSAATGLQDHGWQAGRQTVITVMGSEAGLMAFANHLQQFAAATDQWHVCHLPGDPIQLI